MSLSDCPDCWETICKCGTKYRYMAPDDSASVIWAVLRYRSQAERRDIMARVEQSYRQQQRVDGGVQPQAVHPEQEK